jgi:hypothetical protein
MTVPHHPTVLPIRGVPGDLPGSQPCRALSSGASHWGKRPEKASRATIATSNSGSVHHPATNDAIHVPKSFAEIGGDR